MKFNIRKAIGGLLVMTMTGFGTTGAIAQSGSPIGNFESAVATAGGLVIKGWTLDPNTSASIYVWVTIDGVGQHVYANGLRPDVAAVYPGYNNTGFSKTLAAAPGTRRVCVTASNVGAGSHTSLGCRDVTVRSGSPFGNLETIRAVSGGVEIKGWAIDPDTTDSIYMWVTVNGVGSHLFANISRPDVGSAYPGYGNYHGFARVVTIGSGYQRVCVTASNVGEGSHNELGCKDFGAPPPIPNSGWARPLSGYTVTQEFTGSSGHNGIDLAKGYGSTVVAARAGRVKAIIAGYCQPGVNCWNSMSGWQLDPVYRMSGDKVVVEHVDGMLSIYDHCGAISGIYVGKSVSLGQAICQINRTGNRGGVTGAHLHFSIFTGSTASTATNPRYHISL